MRRIREVRLIAACITLALLVLAPGGTARAQEDSARVHGTLRKVMHQFFMAWRKEWIASELERNDPQERFGRAAPESPRARRVGMQVCPKVWSSAVLPPMMVRYRFQEGEHSVLRWIQTKRGDTPGAVCVDWIFDPTTGYPDESERLDHALSLERRRPMYAAREQLLRTISQAATRYPADRWILGQQIRFLLDQVQLDAALAAAQSCEGDDTLCLSLRGLAHAARGDIVAAEAHFTAYDSVVSRAGRTAADSVGCRVDELAMLRPRTDRALEKTPCARLDSLVQTLWWLADPLWSEPGNTRFVEHHVRRVQVALRAVTDEDERYPWGRLCDREARRSQVLRYGWPSYHYLITDRYPPRGAPPQVCPFTPPLTLEYSEQQVSLIPQWRALEDPFGATPDDWWLTRPDSIDRFNWWPQEFVRIDRPLDELPEGQLAQLRRDTTVRLGLAIERIDERQRPSAAASAAIASTSLPAVAVLMGATAPGALEQLDSTTADAGAPFRWRAEVDDTPRVLSAEVLATSERQGHARRRFGLRPAPALQRLARDSVALSQPLLIVAGVPQDAWRGEALADTMLAALRPSTVFTRSDTLDLYWESYGFARRDSVEITVSVARRRENGALRRLVGAITPGSPDRDSIAISWREAPESGTGVPLDVAARIVGRRVRLDLAPLVPGRYAVLVEVRARGGRVARGERGITVR